MVKHDGEWSQNLALNQISRGNNELTILTEGGNIDVKLVTCQARDSGAGFLMNFKEDWIPRRDCCLCQTFSNFRAFKSADQ